MDDAHAVHAADAAIASVAGDTSRLDHNKVSCIVDSNSKHH